MLGSSIKRGVWVPAWLSHIARKLSQLIWFTDAKIRFTSYVENQPPNKQRANAKLYECSFKDKTML